MSNVTFFPKKKDTTYITYFFPFLSSRRWACFLLPMHCFILECLVLFLKDLAIELVLKEPSLWRSWVNLSSVDLHCKKGNQIPMLERICSGTESEEHGWNYQQIKKYQVAKYKGVKYEIPRKSCNLSQKLASIPEDFEHCSFLLCQTCWTGELSSQKLFLTIFLNSLTGDNTFCTTDIWLPFKDLTEISFVKHKPFRSGQQHNIHTVDVNSGPS